MSLGFTQLGSLGEHAGGSTDVPALGGAVGVSRRESVPETLRPFRGILAVMGVRCGLPVLEAEEIAREVVRLAAGRVGAFPGPGGEEEGRREWLFEMMRWRIADRLDRRGDGGRRVGSNAAGEEARRTMDLALYRMARKAPSRDFQVFELAVKQGWTMVRIARAFGLNLAVVWMIKQRLGRQLRRELASLEVCWG